MVASSISCMIFYSLGLCGDGEPIHRSAYTSVEIWVEYGLNKLVFWAQLYPPPKKRYVEVLTPGWSLRM